jgi:hypothetical protein
MVAIALASAESGNARTARSAFFVQSQQASGRREISQMQNFVRPKHATKLPCLKLS